MKHFKLKFLRSAYVALPLLWLLASNIPAQPTALETDIPQLIKAAASYESGQSMESLRRLEALARQSSGNRPLRDEVEAGLVRLLTMESTLEAKQFACHQLATFGTEASLPALAQLLETEATVALASQALTMHPSPKASEVLRQALPRLRGAARVQVISTLGDRQDAASVESLARLAKDQHTETATAAIHALGKIANAPARETIAALSRQLGKGERPELARDVFEASMSAAERLAAIGERAAAVAIYRDLLDPTQPDNVRRGAFEALLQLDPDGGEQRIVDTLGGTDTLLKPVAIAGMRALRSPEASEKFAAALPGLPPQEQAWLVEALAGRRDAAARTAVERSVISTNALVRLAAIEAVGRASDVTAPALLSKALGKSADAKERTAIERALTGLRHDEESDNALIDELGHATGNVQASLIRVLARRGSRAAVPAILRATQQPDVAGIAFQALASLATADDIPVLLGKLAERQDPDTRSEAEGAAAQALLKTDDPAVRTDAVLAALRHAEGVEPRSSLLRLLPVCATPDALSVLSAARQDSDPRVRDTAIRALIGWPDDRAWDPLAEILQRPSEEAHRVLALNALTRIAADGNAEPNARTVERYQALLEGARTDSDRKLVLGALAEAAHPGALTLALPLLSDPGVRAEAELAVKRIAESIKEEHPGVAADALDRLEPK